MDKIDYSEYKYLEKDAKIEKLNSIWNTEQSILKGWMKNVLPDKSYFFIENVTNLNGSKIKNPFTEKVIDRVRCKPNVNFPLKGFEQVVFKFNINESKIKEEHRDSEKNKPIVAEDISIKPIKDFKEIVEEIEINGGQADLIDIIKEEYSNKRVVFCEDVVDVLKKKNKKIRNEISENKKKISNLDDEIIQKKDKLTKFISEIDEKKDELTKELNEIRENKLIEIEKELENKKKMIEEINELAKKYQEFGFNIDWDKNKPEIQIGGKKDIESKIEQIEYIQKHLAIREEKKLYYDKHIVEMFFSALCTNQIIILCGEPGTGKTSLVEGLADAISAEYRLVSVQPNWTDNQDLLGFYNPVEKAYVSTPFIDAIIEANKYPDRLFFICLDEMNLAHVEYYFSEFLSKLQSKERTLELYSDYIYKQIGKELHAKIKKYISSDIDIEKALINDLSDLNMSSDEIDEYFKLKWQWNMYMRYKSSIKIPDNIRFVGTINKDETTKGLSPKVVDRSFIIELNKFSNETKEDIISNKQEYKQLYERKLYLSANNFKIKRVEQNEVFLQRINKIKDVLKKLKIHLNNRFDDQIEQVIGSDILDDSDKLFDYVISCMVLPKINISIEDNESKLISLLEKELKDARVSKVIFEKMKEYCSKEHVLTFWR